MTRMCSPRSLRWAMAQPTAATIPVSITATSTPAPVAPDCSAPIALRTSSSVVPGVVAVAVEPWPPSASALAGAQPGRERAALGDHLGREAIDLGGDPRRLAVDELGDQAPKAVESADEAGRHDAPRTALDPAHDRLRGVGDRQRLAGRAAQAPAHGGEARMLGVGAAHHVGVDPREVGDADVDAEVGHLDAQDVEQVLEAGLRRA